MLGELKANHMPPETNKLFDVIVIGSSPFLMAEALFLERQGYRVALVEKRNRLGGAWYTTPVWEFDSIQVGCHYIERGRNGRVFLQETLGIPLEPMTVKAVWLDVSDMAEKGDSVFKIIARRIAISLLWGRYLPDDF